MNSPERQQLPSSILPHLFMFEIITFSLFNDSECFEYKIRTGKGGEIRSSEWLNGTIYLDDINQVTFALSGLQLTIYVFISFASGTDFATSPSAESWS